MGEEIMKMVREMMSVQEASFVASFKIMFEDVKNEIKSLRTELNDLRKSLEFSQADIEKVEGKIKALETNVDKSKLTIQQHDVDIEAVQDGVEYIENQSRRNNIKLVGLDEGDEERSWSDTEEVFKQCIKEKLGIEEEIVIERAHRVGNKRDDVGKTRQDGSVIKPRPIIAKLQSWKQKEHVISEARKKKPDGVAFFQDLAARTLERRRNQIPALLEARQRGKLAFFVMDRLVVKDRPPGSQFGHQRRRRHENSNATGNNDESETEVSFG